LFNSPCDPGLIDEHERPAADTAAHLDDVDLVALAAQMGTPLHAYSASAIRARIDGLLAALEGTDALVCYAAKANTNLAIVQLMAERGLGADIVSSGELWRCLRAGIPASRIVFSGVGKTAQEIAEALEAGVGRFNLESRDELETLQRVAAAAGVVATAAVRINPDVDALTHAKISTGRAENKFGVSIDEARHWFDTAAEYPNVRLDGLHAHIGSQLLQLAPIRAALARVAAFWRELEQAGHRVASIDVGGGLGVCYRHGEDRPIAAADYVAAIRDALQGFGGRLLLEPGRYLVAEAGVLLTRVVRVKPGEQRQFLVVDAAMTELIRPSLYDAWHDIAPVLPSGQPAMRYDVVGPVCESSDTFARDRQLPRCAAGDLLMIRGTGAYAASMASTYNSRPLAAEVLLDTGRYAEIRRRQSFSEMIAGEQSVRQWQTT
jgi:diaminopimelate decarboxylase